MTEFVEKTIKELGAVISAPKLTEKTLSRPPFRFLHDIVTNFISSNGFPEGLYSADMLNSSKVTEKESKIEFLNLLIAAVEAATGKKVEASAQKVVAGQEPELTNALLQLLASCAALSADKKKAAVAKAKSEPSKTPKKRRESEKKEPEKGKEEKKEEKKEKEVKKDKEEKKEKEENKEDKGNDKDEERRKKEKEEKRRREKEKEKEKKKQEEKEKERGKDGDKKGDKEDDEERRRRHEERKEKERKKKEEERKKSHSADDTRRSSGGAVSEPTTAGKAPPRTKPTHQVVVAHSAVDAAPASGVIREAKRGEDAEESEEESDWQKVADQYDAKPAGVGAAVGEDVEVKGALGQQALKAKKRQDAARKAQEEAVASAAAAAPPAGGGIIIRSSKKGGVREGGVVIGETELTALREQLQLLTKASNPLGKFLEAIHDDIDSMSRELEMWRSEARNQSMAAEDAHRQTQESLREGQAQLQNLEDAITDQLLKTNNLRRNILANDQATQNMMRMIVNPEVANRS